MLSRLFPPVQLRPLLFSLATLLATGARSAEPAIRWNWRLPFPTGNNLRDVAYGAGHFVAVGDYGTVLSSTNGSRWVSHDAAGGLSMKAVSFWNGQFIATGNDGTLLTSADATAWTTLPRVPGYHLGRVIFGNGRLVMTGQGIEPRANALFSSTSPETWRRRDLPRAQQVEHLAYGNGFFLAAGFDGSTGVAITLTSVDGLTWTSVPTAPPEHLSGLGFGNGRFVAVSALGGIWTTEDGAHWESRSPVGPPYLRSVAFVNGRFLALVNEEPTILVSTDGVNWAAESSDVWRSLIAVAGGDGRAVAVGFNGQICLSTSPGIWRGQTHYGTQTYLAAIPPDVAEPILDNWRERFFAITYGRDRFVAVGLGVAAASTTGRAWVFSPAPSLPALTDVVFDGKAFVAVAMTGVVARSADGLEWDVWTVDPEIQFTSIGMSDGRYYLVGRLPLGRGSVILASRDLLNWTPVHVAPANALLGFVAGHGHLVVTSPENKSVLTSTNGIDWAETRTGETLIAGLVFDPTYGFQAVNAQTAEGVAWNLFPSPATEELDDLAEAGFLRAATDSRWIGQPPPGGGGLTLRSYGLGRLYTSGSLRRWDLSLSVNPPLHAIVRGADTFVAVGMGTVLQSDELSTIAPVRMDVSRHDADSLQLTVESVPGARVVVESGIVPGNWNPIRTGVNESGITHWMETIPPDDPHRFYRATSAPR